MPSTNGEVPTEVGTSFCLTANRGFQALEECGCGPKRTFQGCPLFLSSSSILSTFLVQKQLIPSRLGFTPQESDRMQPAAEYGRR